MRNIINAILKGFNPDPSIVRVDEDFYIVTSTFEWFPGCQIHHSKNLVNWQLINRTLDRVSQLDMKGAPILMALGQSLLLLMPADSTLHCFTMKTVNIIS